MIVGWIFLLSLCLGTTSLVAGADDIKVVTSCSVVSQRVQCGDLTCNATTRLCVPCTQSFQCGNEVERCVAGRCVLRSFIDNLDVGTIMAFLCVIIVCSIAVVAGVGGGGILVPLFVASLGVPMVNAVALSQATIAGQSFFNLMMLINRHHPDFDGREATRPIINYEYLTLLLPISLIGTMYGGMMGKIVPDWFRVVCLMALLGILSVRVVRKALKQWRKDSSRVLPSSSPTEGITEMKFSPRGDQSLDPAPSDEQQDIVMESEGDEPHEQLPQYPPRELAACAAMFLILFFFNAVRTNYDCGSFLYFLMYALPTVILGSLFLIIFAALRRRWKMVMDGILLSDEIPFAWSTKTTVVFPLLAVTAGAAASLLGIGGGLVLSTLLFEAKLSPEEASATGGVATLLVATASAAQFLLTQQLRVDYAIAFFVCGMASSIIGQFGMVRPIRRNGWNYMILLSLAFVLIGSMISLTALGVYNTMTTLKRGGSLAFASLCK